MAKTKAERKEVTLGMEAQADRLKDTRVQIFTDGAISGNGRSDKGYGGYGALLLYKDKVKEVSGGSPDPSETNQTMELMGAIKGLEAVKIKKFGIDLYSDSAYIVNCFNQKWYKKWENNGWINSKGDAVANQELWRNLISLVQSFKEVKFWKVNGHCATSRYNAKADELAVKGKNEMKRMLESEGS